MNNFGPDIEEYGMEFFHAMSDQLRQYSVNVRTRYGFPMLGRYSGPEGQGTYFRREAFGDWSPREMATIKDFFPFIYRGQAVRLAHISQPESDDDRTWPASFTVVPYDMELAEREIYDSRGEFSTDYYNSLM